MKVTLLACTPMPDVLVATAGRSCYSTQPPEQIHETMIAGSDDKISRQINIIHGSCFEHSSFTFSIEGISRVCSHQLVRHRLASFSQQSQRYTKVSDREVYRPGSIGGDTDAEYIYYKAIDAAFNAYEDLIKRGIPKEDARYVLPESALSNLTMTMNARELLHFFSLRCCHRAQEEIRELAEEMERICREVAPHLFRNSGPACRQLGYCPEHKSCGRAPPIQDLRSAWWKTRMMKPRTGEKDDV